MNDYKYTCRLLKEIKPNNFRVISVAFTNTYYDLPEMEKNLQPPKRRICRYKMEVLGPNSYEFKTYPANASPFKPTIPVKYLRPTL
jgi:hypothetical protein